MPAAVNSNQFTQDPDGPMDGIRIGHGKIQPHGVQAHRGFRKKEMPRNERHPPLHGGWIDLGQIDVGRGFDPHEHAPLGS